MTLPPPKRLLETYGLRPKHSFGQNFLSDAHLAGKIAALAIPGAPHHVLEIGSGLGALTDELLARGSHVVAIERDRDLVPALTEIFAEPLSTGRLLLLEDDAKAVDWRAQLERLEQATEKRPWVLAGNLPYQITGPLIEKTVHLGRVIERAVYLVQKEVADRLAAVPGTKNYGALSVFVQAQFLVERAFVIKAGAFYPQPRIDSAVVVLRPHEAPLAEETRWFQKVVKSAFAARRKTLRNAWKSLAAAEIIHAAAQAAQIDLDQRGETLSVVQFGAMARYLEEREENAP